MPGWESPAPGPAYSDNPWQVFLPRKMKSSAHDNSRGTERLSYPFPQRFAPYREERWPKSEEFKAVDLCDISSVGLALLLPQRPTCTQYVVELGIGANVSQVLVQVIQVSPVAAPFVNEDPANWYRVGCEILPHSKNSTDEQQF